MELEEEEEEEEAEEEEEEEEEEWRRPFRRRRSTSALGCLRCSLFLCLPCCCTRQRISCVVSLAQNVS